MVISLFEQMTPVLSVLWNDRMDVYRSETYTDANGFTKVGFPQTPQEVDKACHASLLIEDPIEGQDVEKSIRQVQVFCDNALNVPAGCKVVVRRMRSNGSILREYSGTRSETNDPNTYHGHQAFILELENPV